MRYAMETGGNERTRDLAIKWLDDQTRYQRPLSDLQEVKLLKDLNANLHPDWDIQYRFLFFNSAFELLHLGQHQEEYTRLLRKLSMDDPEKVMRLYALQHIGFQRSLGHLTGPLADEIRTNLHTLASVPASPVAGSALQNLIEWDGPEIAPDSKLIELALKFAADSTYSVDVRVTALHATREQSLSLARTLASDTTQPTPLRKASISLMGQHGGVTDRPALETLRAENYRMAQAAEPALRAIAKRQPQS